MACGVWRVAWCVFARCLALQLSPPAKRQDGGGSPRRRLGAALERPAAGVRRLSAGTWLLYHQKRKNRQLCTECLIQRPLC